MLCWFLLECNRWVADAEVKKSIDSAIFTQAHKPFGFGFAQAEVVS
jgi:hypothetical protein